VPCGSEGGKRVIECLNHLFFLTLISVDLEFLFDGRVAGIGGRGCAAENVSDLP
jgi:hypothetical protein